MIKRFFESRMAEARARLEAKFTPEKEPIIDRPYQITPEAYQRFAGWGVGKEIGAQLEKLGSSYTYARPEKRAENMFNGGIAFVHVPGGEKQILYQKYSSTNPDDSYGECTELAKRVIVKGVKQGIFNVQTRFGKLAPMLVGGYSPTHFNKGSARHYWVGLIPEQMAEDNFRTMVVYDPSYRIVTTMEHSGYSIDVREGEHHLSRDIPQVEEDYHYKNLGSIIFQKESFGADFTGQSEAVLGITPDYKFGVSLSICKNMANESRTHGLVVLHDDEGQVAYVAAHSPKTQSTIILPKNGHEFDELSDKSQIAIFDILRVANQGLEKLNP